MHLPIRYALGYPERLHTSQPPLSLEQYSRLSFEAPDTDRFPLLRYAFDAIEAGGNTPCVLNAANEIAVSAFLNGRLPFVEMPGLVAATIESVAYSPHTDYDTLVQTNAEARAKAEEILTIL